MGRLSKASAERCFADREAHGFNTAGWIDVACAGHDYPDDKAGSTPDGILPFTGFFSGGTDYIYYDISKPIESYLARLDHMIQIASKHGILVLFFSSLPWQALVPDQDHKVVTAGFGTFGDSEVHFDRGDLTASMTPRVSQSDYATAAKTPDG
jgi:hypothetical protein